MQVCVSLPFFIIFKVSKEESSYFETKIRVLVRDRVGMADLEDDGKTFLLNRFPDVLGRIRALHMLALREWDIRVSSLADLMRRSG